MGKINFIIDESANNSDADIWFALPAGFVETPLNDFPAMPDSERGIALNGSWQALLASAPDEALRERLNAELAAAQQMLLALTETGTVHCSLGLHTDDVKDAEDSENDPRAGTKNAPLLSLFTITWHDTAWSPPAVKAARAIASDEDLSHLDAVALPCGPATFSEKVRQVPPDSGLPTAPLLQLFAHLPHPDGKRLAVLTLSTTAVHRREDYRAILRQIAEMVSFENPLPTTS